LVDADVMNGVGTAQINGPRAQRSPVDVVRSFLVGFVTHQRQWDLKRDSAKLLTVELGSGRDTR
jgi:hypothetical protein